MELICRICGINFSNQLNHPHRAHKIRLAEYFYKYYGKKDLLTGEQIKFKSVENYLLTDFISKTNLNTFVRTKDAALVKDYCKDLLIRRKEVKNLYWTPTQVELRSQLGPSVITYNKYFGNYYRLAAEIGYHNKHELSLPTNLSSKKVLVFIDSREQTPLSFRGETQIVTLPFGDYCCPDNDLIYFERKSLQDWISTLSAGFDRFKREIERAAEAKKFLFVIVECPFSKALSFNYSYFGRFTKCSSEFILHRMRDLLQTYPLIQFIFAKDREESARIMGRILANQEIFQRIDVQLCLDLNLI